MKREKWKERHGKREIEREIPGVQVMECGVGKSRVHNLLFSSVNLFSSYKLIKWANNNNYVEKCEYFNHILNGLIKT